MNVKPLPIPSAADPRPLDTQEEDVGESSNLLEYWRTINKRKWSILGLALAITLLAYLFVSSIRPTFRAGTTILIEQQRNKIVSIEDLYSGVSNRDNLQTQMEILKSRELAVKVAEKLKLARHPEFDPRQEEPPYWKRWLASAGLNLADIGLAAPEVDGVKDKDMASDAAVMPAVVGRILGQLSVEPTRNSQLVRVGFDSYDPQTAAGVANAVVETFIENDLEARYQMTRKASDWLSERIRGLREKGEVSERALQQFREKEGILVARGITQSDVTGQLDEISTTFNEAARRRAEAESKYNQIRGIRSTSVAAYDSVPAVMNQPMFARTREAEIEMEKRVAELSSRYGKEHPRMIQAQAELKGAHENSRRALEIVLASIAREYETTRASEAAAERKLSKTKSEIQEFNRKEFQLTLLERDVAANRQLYEMFLGRSRETSAVGDLQSTAARVIDPALPPGSPYKPDTRRMTLNALMAGLFVGVILALLLERLDSTVKTSADVETKLGLPVLASLPVISDRGVKVERIVEQNPQSMFSEGIRTARTGILLSSIDEPHRAIVVTSSVPGEGKTTFATNLALSFSQTRRTVLVDADMRRPSIGKLFGREPNAPGLSTLVSGNTPPTECVFKSEGTELHVIASGTIPPNPLELLLSKRFEDTLHKLQEMFEMVIIDSPPVQLVSDALVISRHCSGLVYMVKADDTPFQIARNGVKRVRRAQANIIGVALNKLDFERADKYYGEYTGYSKYGYKRYYGAYGGKKRKAAA